MILDWALIIAVVVCAIQSQRGAKGPWGGAFLLLLFVWIVKAALQGTAPEPETNGIW